MYHSVRITEGQSFFDIALQYTGNAKNAILIAKHNNLNPTEDLVPGKLITIPEEVTELSDIKNYYKSNNLNPSTNLNQEANDILFGCEGIECWAVEIDFKVS